MCEVVGTYDHAGGKSPAVPAFTQVNPRIVRDTRPAMPPGGVTESVLDELPLIERLRAAVFIYLDNLIPEFQDRPRRTLVNEWYSESGFGPVTWNEPGLFWATKRAET